MESFSIDLHGQTTRCKELLKGIKHRVYIETFGCQQNFADSDALRALAFAMGYQPTENQREADLIIFNTCAIREHAEKKLLSKVGEAVHLKHAKPSLIIAVCGCMMQQEHRRQEIVASYPHVDIVLGTHTLSALPEAVESVLRGSKLFLQTLPDTEAIPTITPARTDNLVANITIMYGCNNFCTYCIVPYTRGREKSRDSLSILDEARDAIHQGHKELLLLGQNVNSFSGGGLDFADLLREIDKIEGDYKIKFMTSHPKDANEKLLDTIANGKHIARAIHLPVQSGSEKILSLMNRKYTPEDYVKLTQMARAKIPEIEITTDIIVGFPGETEEEFEKTLELVRRCRFDSAFTFVFSKRSGTAAATMEKQVTAAVKKERMGKLITLQTAISEEINREKVGKLIEVLVLNKKKNSDSYIGKTDGGKVVVIKTEGAKIGQFLKIRVVEGRARELRGTPEI